MSSQVGSAHIAIFPTMTGFKAKILGETKGAGAASGKAFTASMKGAGTSAGKQLGSGVKGAFSGSAKDIAGATLSTLKKDVAGAASALSKARLKQLDEAGRVRVAEARLSEAMDKYGAGSSQVIAAEERLESARRKQQTAADAVKSATDRLKSAQANLASAESSSSSGASKLSGALGALRTGLGNVASKAMSAASALGQKFAAAVRGAATTAVAGLAAGMTVLAAKTVGITKAAVNAYAAWEQAVGGVDTLFKGSSKTVQKYAANAYKTAGLSANDYMSTVTSFSASLISSLGGDTAAAAKLADQAITDMSDNANKMGTDMESIQQTYQSLARGNYAMLDNLKLGYGGTKTEMQRLLKDAEKLSGQKYSIGSFSDVISAIHVVQDELGITGTTAKEAATTIEGSVASMKSAWSNWLAELGKTDGDVEGTTKALTASVGTALGNILPRVQQVISSLIASIPTMMSGLVDALPKPFQKAIDGIISAVDSVRGVLAPLGGMFLALGSGGLAGLLSKLPVVGSMFGGLGGALSLLSGPLGIVGGLLGGLAMVDPSMLVNGFGALIPAVEGVITTMIPQAVAALTDLVPQLVSTLTANIPILLNGAVSLFDAIVQGLTTALPSILTAIVGLLPMLVEALLSMVPSLVTSAIALFNTLIQAVITVAPMLIAAVVALLPQLVTTLVGMLPTLVQSALQLFMALVQGLVQVVPVLLTALVGMLPTVLSAILSMIPALLNAAIQLFLGLVNAIPKILPKLLTTLVGILPSLLSAIISLIPALLNAAVQLFLGLVKAIPKVIPALVSALVAIAPSLVSAIISLIPTLINAGIELFGELASTVAKAWPKIKGALSNLGPQMVSAIAGLIPQMASAGGNLLRGLASGIGNAVGSVVSKAREVAGQVVGAVKGAFGIHSPSRVFRDEIGKQLMAGLAKGVGDGKDGVLSALDDVNTAITKAQEDAVKKEAKRLQEARRKLNKQLVADKKKSLGALSAVDAEKQAKANLAAATADTKAVKAQLKLQKKLTATLWDDGAYKGGIARWRGLNQGTVTLLESITKNGNVRRDAAKSVQSMTLADIGKAQGQITAAIDAAKATLKEMRDASAQLAASVSSSLQGELDLGSAVDENGNTSKSAVMAVVSTLAGKVKKFAGLLSALAKKGLPSGLVQEVASLGTTKGIPVANALKSMSTEETKTLSADYGSLVSWSDKAGKTVADSMYAVGINAQKGLVDGLLKDSDKLEKAAKTLTDKVVKAAKRALGIKSPSRVLRDQVGRFVPAGLAAGIAAGISEVEASAQRMAAAAVPSVPAVDAGGISTSGSSASSGEVNQYISVNVPAAAFADVETLLRFVRSLALRAHVTVGA